MEIIKLIVKDIMEDVEDIRNTWITIVTKHSKTCPKCQRLWES